MSEISLVLRTSNRPFSPKFEMCGCSLFLFVVHSALKDTNTYGTNKWKLWNISNYSQYPYISSVKCFLEKVHKPKII